jgi:hypothetical protein
MRDRSSNKDGGFIMIYDLARDLSIYSKKKKLVRTIMLAYMPCKIT